MIKGNAFHITQMLASIQNEALTARELIEQSGLDRDTVYMWIRELHRVRLIHVERWDKDACGRYVIAAYRWGLRRDARRIYADRNARVRQWRARKKAAEMLHLFAGATS